MSVRNLPEGPPAEGEGQGQGWGEGRGVGEMAVEQGVELDPSELGGDPVCWAGLVEDHRDQ